ncbi:hypothetical protein [Streptomyces sp. NPDC001480]|uniref:hypothetical protein n=1 Tax=Streptomyces sp. NPDC001480 TaxID=3364577 RepID=UPI0036D09588
MNVLVCAACGRRLSEPLRLLPVLPERPGHDGRKGPDGSPHPGPERMGAEGPYETHFLPDAVRAVPV